MKKVLSILGTISLLTIISTNVIACKKPNENNKTTETKFIPQKPPENSDWKLIDNISNENSIKNKDKYYFVIYKNGNKNNLKIYKLQIRKKWYTPI